MSKRNNKDVLVKFMGQAIAQPPTIMALTPVCDLDGRGRAQWRFRFILSNDSKTIFNSGISYSNERLAMQAFRSYKAYWDDTFKKLLGSEGKNIAPKPRIRVPYRKIAA